MLQWIAASRREGEAAERKEGKEKGSSFLSPY
jgi:hypothetical protein